MRPTCRNELIKAGVSLSDLLLVGVCTMQWLSHYVLGTSRRLIDCCRVFRTLEDAHSPAKVGASPISMAADAALRRHTAP